MSSEYLKTSKKSYKLYKKYQNTIHGIPPEKLTEQQYMRFLVKSPLQVISRFKFKSVDKPPVYAISCVEIYNGYVLFFIFYSYRI